MPVSEGLSEANQGWLMSTASLCLISLGRLTETIETIKDTIAIYEKLGDWSNASINANNLFSTYLPIGQLKDAEHAAQLSIAYADRTDDLFKQMVSRTRLATTLHQQGDLQESLKHFEKAEELQKRCYSFPVLLFGGLYSGWYCNLLLNRYTDKKKHEITLKYGQEYFKWRLQCDSYDSLLDIAFGHLTIARALFALNRLDEANTEFDEAVRGIRKAGNVDHVPEFILARAKFLRHQKQFLGAWHDLDEATSIIERCGMKLYAVDANLLEGNLFLDKDDGSEAMKCYKQAKELIEYTGYHLRDAELELLAARLAHLKKDSEKTKDYLNKSYQNIEKIGYWGFLAEWERVKSEFDR